MCIQSCLSAFSIGKECEPHDTMLNVMLYAKILSLAICKCQDFSQEGAKIVYETWFFLQF